ncbi:UNVERIFIED_CONTAM: hypothetical protein GTU68_049736, partial [Idotea baltica]|nr:hypothetical protein [Idotea baltica]
DVLVCRTEHELTPEIRKKLALFCNVDTNAVIEAKDAESIYDVPKLMLEEKIDLIVLDKLRINNYNKANIDSWLSFLDRLKNPEHTVKIALIGKYIELQDAYKSILESFVHAGGANNCKVEVISIQSEKIKTSNVKRLLGELHGVLVAPGFGDRGVEGKINAVKFARENKIPFLGICLGMQCAAIEFARNVLGLKNANSTEMEVDCKDPIIDLMEDQKSVTKMGGTMRLGAYPCTIGTKESHSYKAYKSVNIQERHRHRYEFNNEYLDAFIEKGMIATGINPDSNLVEIIEDQNHPWFVGVQFHPELKSRVTKAHPLFREFVAAALVYKEENNSATVDKVNKLTKDLNV